MFSKSARPLIFAIFIMFILSACNAKTENTATQSTALPEVNTSASSIDLMDLESLSFIPGDLPEGFAAAKAVRTLPEGFYEVENFSDMIYLPLEKYKLEQGSVFVFLFDDNVNRDSAFRSIEEELGKRADFVKVDLQDVPGIGDKAVLMSVDGSTLKIELNIVELVFERCGAVVNISLGDNVALKDVEGLVTSYASLLADRLDLIACK